MRCRYNTKQERTKIYMKSSRKEEKQKRGVLDKKREANPQSP
jgi:hypothetical protein